jgi:hypothetical protein
MAPSAGRKVLVASSLLLSASEASWTSIDSALMGGVALGDRQAATDRRWLPPRSHPNALRVTVG